MIKFDRVPSATITDGHVFSTYCVHNCTRYYARASHISHHASVALPSQRHGLRVRFRAKLADVAAFVARRRVIKFITARKLFRILFSPALIMCVDNRIADENVNENLVCALPPPTFIANQHSADRWRAANVHSLLFSAYIRVVRRTDQ